jgi:hypothetical protein
MCREVYTGENFQRFAINPFLIRTLALKGNGTSPYINAMNGHKPRKTGR